MKAYDVNYGRTREYEHRIGYCSHNKKHMRWEKRCKVKIMTLNIYHKYDHYIVMLSNGKTTICQEETQFNQGNIYKDKVNYITRTFKKFPKYVETEIKEYIDYYNQRRKNEA